MTSELLYFSCLGPISQLSQTVLASRTLIGHNQLCDIALLESHQKITKKQSLNGICTFWDERQGQ